MRTIPSVSYLLKQYLFQIHLNYQNLLAVHDVIHRQMQANLIPNFVGVLYDEMEVLRHINSSLHTVE